MMLLPHADLPSPPGIPSYTVQQYGQYNVNLTVEWDPPEYDGGTVVNYTITIIPGHSRGLSETSVPVTLSYNVAYNLSVLATNCIGSTSTSMETITLGIYFPV